MRKQNDLLFTTVKVIIESSAKDRHISATWSLCSALLFILYKLIFTLFPDTYRPGACERDVCYTGWESLRDCRRRGTGVDQSHWERGNNSHRHTHTHTHTQWCVNEVSRMTTTLSPFPQTRGDKVKLSFSMKAVNQGTGRDMDPNNVMAE